MSTTDLVPAQKAYILTENNQTGKLQCSTITAMKRENRGIWEGIGGSQPSVVRAGQSSLRLQELLQLCVCEVGGGDANEFPCTAPSPLSRDPDAEIISTTHALFLVGQ